MSSFEFTIIKNFKFDTFVHSDKSGPRMQQMYNTQVWTARRLHVTNYAIEKYMVVSSRV